MALHKLVNIMRVIPRSAGNLPFDCFDGKFRLRQDSGSATSRHFRNSHDGFARTPVNRFSQCARDVPRLIRELIRAEAECGHC